MMISKETSGLVNAFKNPLIEILGDIKDEVKFYFDKGIINYVESIRNKFINTKTFLYRDNVNFYDVYFPISLKCKANDSYILTDVHDFFKNTNFISVIGNAGSGKSMFMKHVFLTCSKQSIKIPIVMELRNLNEFEGNFFDYIGSLLLGKKITPNKKILERILSNGDFIFLFDGYDEIYSDNLNRITSEIVEFIDNNNKNLFLITSRPGANVESLPRFENYFVNNLSNEQIEKFINVQLNVCNNEKLGEKIIKVINKNENNDYRTFLSSPLLLSMFILTFNSYPELPKSKSKFYWNVFDTLCTKHDTFTKHGGFQHERKTGLQNEDFELILKWFSFSTLFKGKYSFDEQYFTSLLKKIKEKLNLNCSIANLKHDLTIAISIIVIDGLEYKFPHKSLQEYFTALLIKEQPKEVKADIYKKKLAIHSVKTSDRNDNFWNLCFEQDRSYFNKYFILYYLEEFVQKIDTDSEESICKSFFSWLDYNAIMYKNKSNGAFKFGGFQFTPNVTIDILEYLKIFHIANISMSVDMELIDKQELIDKLNQAGLIKKGEEGSFRFRIDYSNSWNEDLYSLVKLEEKKDYIIDVLNSTKAKVLEIKKDIESEERKNLELLEL